MRIHFLPMFAPEITGVFDDRYAFVVKDDEGKDDIPKSFYQVMPEQADLSNPSLVDRISE